MKTLTSISLTLALSLMSLCLHAQKHGISVSSDIGLSGQFHSPRATNIDYPLNLYQHYATGYIYETENWSFGANLYYLDHRNVWKFEGAEYLNGPIIISRSIYSSRHLGIAPFVSRTIFNSENYSFSLKFMPGIDNIIIAKQYFEKYPPDDPDDVTVLNDWGKDEYGNYDQINFNLTLALEANRAISENINFSGGLFLFSYLHNNTRGTDSGEIFLPHAFGLNLEINYMFNKNDKY